MSDCTCHRQHGEDGRPAWDPRCVIHPTRPPSPLREQIAHATRDALSEANRMDEAYAPRPSDPPLLDRQTLAVADAVLPLVEAAVAAEREAAGEQLVAMTRIALERGEAAGVVAERLRLHTQLRDQRDAITDAIDKRLRPYAHGRSTTVAVLAAGDVIALLLGVAATPQHETLIRDIALLGEPPGFDATCSCGWRGAIGCITRAQAEAQAAEHLAGVAATPQPEAHDA